MQVMLSKKLQDLVIEAGEVIATSFFASDRPDVTYKAGVADFVTELDKATEYRLIKELSALLPSCGFFAEESASKNVDVLKSHEYVWIIDPIDGTTNFVHKIPFCAISVALYRVGKPILGVVYNPILRDMFVADSQGAWHNGSPIRVSQNTAMAGALFATGIVSSNNQEQAYFYQLLEHLTNASRGFRRVGSAALDLCYVARGTMDVYYEAGIHAWDVAAGAFLVQQAGGTVSDYSGNKDFLFNRNIVAGNSLHAEVLAAIAEYRGD